MALQEHLQVGARSEQVAAAEPVSSLAVGTRGPAVFGWTTTIRARLLAAFAAFWLATVAACAIGIALFANIGTLFEATVATGVRQYGATVRLREQATQLANATAALTGADDRVQFEAACHQPR